MDARAKARALMREEFESLKESVEKVGLKVGTGTTTEGRREEDAAAEVTRDESRLKTGTPSIHNSGDLSITATLQTWNRYTELSQEELKRGTGTKEVQEDVWDDQLRRARERARSIVGYKSRNHR